MKNIKKIISQMDLSRLVGVFFGCGLLLFASVNPAGAYLRENDISAFSISSGARQIALSAFVAQADDPSASLYNPAGLAWTRGLSINSGSDNVSAFQAYPSAAGYVLGLGAVVRNSANYSSNVIIGTYASKLNQLWQIPQNDFTANCAVGINLKGALSQTYRQTGISDQLSNGWDADLGVLWKINPWLNVGGNYKNFLGQGFLGAGSFAWTGGTAEAIFDALSLGTSVKLIGDTQSPIYSLGNELFINADVNFDTVQSTPISVGVEWANWNTYFARMGWRGGGGTDPGISLGGGVRKEGWGFDIATPNVLASNGMRIVASFLYFPRAWKFAERKELPIKDPIKIFGSRDEEISYAETILVSGEVVSGGKVFINGESIYLSDGKYFSVAVPLSIGKNLIDIRGEYRGEEVLRYGKKVLRKAKVVIAEEKKVEQKIETLVKTQEKVVSEKKQKVEQALKSKTTSRTQKTKLLAEKKKLVAEEKVIVQKKKALVIQQKKIAERKEKVEALVTMGVVEVAPDKEFEMEAAVSRGELATWLVKAAGIPLEPVNEKLFRDVAGDDPLAPYIKAVVDLGLMQGFPDGNFYPNRPVSEEDGKAIFKKFGLVQ